MAVLLVLVPKECMTTGLVVHWWPFSLVARWTCPPVASIAQAIETPDGAQAAVRLRGIPNGCRPPNAGQHVVPVRLDAEPQLARWPTAISAVVATFGPWSPTRRHPSRCVCATRGADPVPWSPYLGETSSARTISSRAAQATSPKYCENRGDFESECVGIADRRVRARPIARHVGAERGAGGQ